MALERYFAKYLTKYRIQELRPHSRPMGYRKLIGFLALNTCFVPFVISLMRLFVDLDTVSTEPLGPLETCISLGFSIIANEVTFFYGHWLMHANKWFYANIHKIHHEFKAPCALAAVYCHPLELILSDFLPLGIGMLCFNTNLYFMAVFTAIAVLGTQTHHCGYKWPWIASHGNQPDFHDYHHEKFTCNYGNVGLLDLLHGTYQKPKNLLTSRREEKPDSSNMDPKTPQENGSKQSEDIDKNEILTKLPSKSRASSPGVRALREKTA
jgi:sterol desaturase/sphingolipid hydroxylase (fatty acid hydroxylase superfamily)